MKKRITCALAPCRRSSRLLVASCPFMWKSAAAIMLFNCRGKPLWLKSVPMPMSVLSASQRKDSTKWLPTAGHRRSQVARRSVRSPPLGTDRRVPRISPSHHQRQNIMARSRPQLRNDRIELSASPKNASTPWGRLHLRSAASRGARAPDEAACRAGRENRASLRAAERLLGVWRRT